jgi:hypothetical protein
MSLTTSQRSRDSDRDRFAAENGKSCVSCVKRGRAHRKVPAFSVFFFLLKLFMNLKSTK